MSKRTRTRYDGPWQERDAVCVDVTQRANRPLKIHRTEGFTSVAALNPGTSLLYGQGLLSAAAGGTAPTSSAFQPLNSTKGTDGLQTVCDDLAAQTACRAIESYATAQRALVEAELAYQDAKEAASVASAVRRSLGSNSSQDMIDIDRKESGKVGGEVEIGVKAESSHFDLEVLPKGAFDLRDSHLGVTERESHGLSDSLARVKSLEAILRRNNVQEQSKKMLKHTERVTVGGADYCFDYGDGVTGLRDSLARVKSLEAILRKNVKEQSNAVLKPTEVVTTGGADYRFDHGDSHLGVTERDNRGLNDSLARVKSLEAILQKNVKEQSNKVLKPTEVVTTGGADYRFDRSDSHLGLTEHNNQELSDSLARVKSLEAILRKNARKQQSFGVLKTTELVTARGSDYPFEIPDSHLGVTEHDKDGLSESLSRVKSLEAVLPKNDEEQINKVLKPTEVVIALPSLVSLSAQRKKKSSTSSNSHVVDRTTPAEKDRNMTDFRDNISEPEIGRPIVHTEPLKKNSAVMEKSTRTALFGRQTMRGLNVAEIVHLLTLSCTPLSISPQPPSSRPSSGSVFLYDRKLTRNYRDDGYDWVKKRNKPNKIREDHVKLRLNGRIRVAGLYAHSVDDGSLSGIMHRRSYHLLKESSDGNDAKTSLAEDGDGRGCKYVRECDLVLVHYLNDSKLVRSCSA